MEMDKRFVFYYFSISCLFHTVFLDCPEPAPVANAYRVWETGTSGNVTYICLFGYIHTSGDLVRVCHDTGIYSGEPPVCTLECETPADAIGTVRVFNGTKEGAHAIYSCASGYTLHKYSSTRTCSTSSGGWRYKPLSCTNLENLAIYGNTSQSSTQAKTDTQTYVSDNAVDDSSSSYSATKYENKPWWQLSFGDEYYNIHYVNISLEPADSESTDVKPNMSVALVLYNERICRSTSAESSDSFYHTQCNSHCKTLRVYAQHLTTGSLKISNALIYGRDHRYPCDRPGATVGAWVEYNSTEYDSKSMKHCENKAGFFYQGGKYRGACYSADSGFGGMYMKCKNDENVVRGKYATITSPNSTIITDFGENYEIKVVTISFHESDLYNDYALTISRDDIHLPNKTCVAESRWNYHLEDHVMTRAFKCAANPYGRYVALHVHYKTKTVFKLRRMRLFGRHQADGPLECLTETHGPEYKGQVNFTVFGETCVRWDTISDLDVTSNDLPDYSVEEAGNYCRNPSGEKQSPWCYTSLDKQWNYCPLSYCKSMCAYGKHGDQYEGRISYTKSGQLCQKWQYDVPHPHRFKLRMQFPSSKIYNNYCRNPLASQNSPWCFTTNSSILYEACDISTCNTQFEVVEAKAYNDSTWAPFQNQEECFHWTTTSTGAHWDPTDPAPLCGTNAEIVILCIEKDENVFKWKYIHLDCVEEITSTSTFSTTASSSTTTTTTTANTTTESNSTTSTTTNTTQTNSMTTTSTSLPTSSTSATTTTSTTPTTSSADNMNTTTTSATTETTTHTTITPTTSLITMTEPITSTPANGRLCMMPSSELTNETRRSCRCWPTYTSDVETLKSMAENSSKHLILNKKHISKYKRLFYSVADDRKVSVSIGSSSIVILFVLTIFITSTDIWNVMRCMFYKKQ